MQDKIIIRGARQHNLKNIDLEIPKNNLIVFTGISGSGKSSLAFDTIYAEGQRRYVESLSSYARQFLGIMDKPDVDAIEGLSPAISIDQKSSSHNPRSTVGTITEIYDYLRLLFARIGHPHCPNCGIEISKLSAQQIVDNSLTLFRQISNQYGKKPVRLLILSPVIRDRKGEFKDLFLSLKSKGFTKIRVDGKIYKIGDDLVLIKTNKHSIDVVIDRLTINRKDIKNLEALKNLKSRLSDSLEQAITMSDGLVTISEVTDPSFEFPENPNKLIDHLFSQRFACPRCNISISEIEPRLFSFNSPHGACPKCSGIGLLLRVDPELILKTKLSITEGGILPFARLILSDTWFGRLLLKAAESIGINPHQPIQLANQSKLNELLYGTGDEIYEVTGENRFGRVVTINETFSGVIPELEKRYSETDSEHIREEIGKYLREEKCPDCMGKRLKPESLSITIDHKTIIDICNYSIDQSLLWLKVFQKNLSPTEQQIANLIIKELDGRLKFLSAVGLNYLTLDRAAKTLAGGEAQRIRLASQIGSGLSGVLYVLDEPSIGLHSRDNKRLIDTLKNLKDLGNTVIVVEHDREMMENADLIYDFGPGAGKSGGCITAIGTIDEIKKNNDSTTGLYLSNKKIIRVLPKRSIAETNSINITIKGCKENNLKNLNVTFPLNKFICVTGVSGSGKSTLVVDTLYHILASHLNPYHREKAGKYENIIGLENLKRVILIDQSPIGRTPRSNPATYTGIFTYIRDLFAQTLEARGKGYRAGRFSFNVKGGRCEACEGVGQIKIEMQFLPDVYVACDVCRGSRYNFDTLEVFYKNKNIADILNLSVAEALNFFTNIPGLYNKLETLHKVGLSYIHLGQPAPQLSGGEAQRVKLATELAKTGTKNTLYILDEPTTGLHFADLEKLVFVLRQLVDLGNTVVVIEHNLDVIKNSDWIIDLGPEGGAAGGYIVAEGTPIQLGRNKKSYTGQFLNKIISL